MTTDLKKHLSKILNESILRVSSISGGDISMAYRIDTTNNIYFLKLNRVLNALKMFKAEAYGLQLIAETNTIKTPRIIACNSFRNIAFLILEFIESKSPSTKDFRKFGYQLANLHNSSSVHFGLNQNNFIGNLTQNNTPNKNWTDFYTSQRLIPQLNLAKQKQLLLDKEIPSEQQIKERLRPLFINVKPSILHGDLWSGNYLISKDGTPFLIDPAIYYGHNEVDIAMTKLFGGFDDTFYEAYFSIHKKDENIDLIIEIYQLYFLLVHLNLFGSSYYNSVKSILEKHF